MPAETGDAARQAVEAVLAVTPIDPVDGLVIVEWPDSDHWAPPGPRARYGRPGPIAARQAAAVLRWLHANAERWVQSDDNGWQAADRLAALADAIEEVGRGDRA